MIQLRKSSERGFANHGWLKSLHTFSFASYYDPKHMGFRSLRVINEDRIAGGTGFGAHPHRDMEIISYVVKGALEHQDSMGTKSIIRPGEVQRMSAGSGITHSEFNAMADQETHFFQIWIQPNERGGSPGYGQKSFADELDSGKLTLVVSQDGRDGSIGIKQDANIFIARLNSEAKLEFKQKSGRGTWIQVVKGHLIVKDTEVFAGDAIYSEEESLLSLEAKDSSELILFDLV